MVISINPVKEFIPEWNGNKDMPENERIRVFHKAPTMELVDKLIPKPTIVMKTGNNGVEGGEMEIVVDNRKFVREMITSIRNLTVDVPDNNGGRTTKLILTAEELLAPSIPAVLFGLVDEIGAHLQKVLSQREVNEKNSE